MRVQRRCECPACGVARNDHAGLRDIDLRRVGIGLDRAPKHEMREVQATGSAGGSDPTAYDHSLFIIHAPADAEFVRGYLVPALNLPPDQVQLMDALPLGSLTVTEIDRAVDRSRFTVAVLSPAFLADRWAMFGEQLASHVSTRAPRVIPLMLEDLQLPVRLDARVALDFTDQARWDAEAARLRDLLSTAAPVVEGLACPYPGMRPFRERDASSFFGRDAELEDLIGRLDRGEREIYVIGPSGSGKSSLVHAGLLHELDAGSCRLGRSFAVRTMRPGERPMDRLADVLGEDLSHPARLIEALVARHPPAERALVFVDQLEEVFTIAAAAERQRFIAALASLRTVRQCHVLLALRADFFGALLDSGLVVNPVRFSPVVVAPLRGPALAHAIQMPAQRQGVHLDPRLCDRLVADAADAPGALPLVQETLRLLWDRRRHRFIGLGAYQALDGGSVLGVAISRRANMAMSELTPAQQVLARRVLLRLVSFGEGRADTRRQQELRALQSHDPEDAAIAAVLERLVEHRLITVDRSEQRRETLVDLSHEALITCWPELRGWIDDRRAEELRRRRLEARAAEWMARGWGETGLLDAVELAEAEHWMGSEAASELGYGRGVGTLVRISRSELVLQKQRRRNRVLLIAAALVIVSLTLFGFWRQGGIDRHDAEAYRLLEQGRALIEDHPTRALVYLVAARERGIESAELRALLGRASLSTPVFTATGYAMMDLQRAMSPDGKHVLTHGDHQVQIWNITNGTMDVEIPGAAGVAAFSPDGKRVIAVDWDGTARVWNAETGAPASPAFQAGDRARVAMFSPDGHRIAVAGETTAQIWNAVTAEPVTPLLHAPDWFRGIAFSADGQRLQSATDFGEPLVWSAATGDRAPATLNRIRGAIAAALSPDGTLLATANNDGTARVWDSRTGTPVTEPLVHQGDVTLVVFSPDGTRIATATGNQTARVWEVATGQPVTGPMSHPGDIRRVAFSRDGTKIVIAGSGGDILSGVARVWSAATGQAVTAPLDDCREVNDAAFSPDGARVLTANIAGTLRIWNVAAQAAAVAPLVHQRTVTAATFSVDGSRIATGAADGAQVWDAATGKPVTRRLHHIPPTALPSLVDHHNINQVMAILATRDRDQVHAVSFSPDGSRLVTAGSDWTARIWDASAGKQLLPPLAHDGPVRAAVFDPSGTRVVTAGDDGTVRIWSADTGDQLAQLPEHHSGPVESVSVAPGGDRIATASADHTARVWYATGGSLTTTTLEHQDAVHAAAFSPDGTRIVTASADHTARIWDAATGAPVTPALEHKAPVNAAAFSPDGRLVVTAGDDRTARLWDAATGAPRTPALEHRGAVRAATFSRDGTRIVTASTDGTARVWDAMTGRPLTVPLEHPRGVVTAVFSPDGARVVTTGEDGTARVWAMSIELGSVDDWRALGRCSPFELRSQIEENRDAVGLCIPIAGYRGSR